VVPEDQDEKSRPEHPAARRTSPIVGISMALIWGLEVGLYLLGIRGWLLALGIVAGVVVVARYRWKGRTPEEVQDYKRKLEERRRRDSR
jgi:uncharacterized iron-regulated membrane protein